MDGLLVGVAGGGEEADVVSGGMSVVVLGATAGDGVIAGVGSMAVVTAGSGGLEGGGDVAGGTEVAPIGRVLGVSLVAGCGRVAVTTFGEDAGEEAGTAATCFSLGGTSIACPSQPTARPKIRASPTATKATVCRPVAPTGRVVGRGGGAV